MQNTATSLWMSWGMGLAEDFGERTALIQILNPGMQPFDFPCEKQLVISFWDRTELDFREGVISRLFGGKPNLCVRLHKWFMGDNGGWPWRPPLSDDARRIREFVDAVPEGWGFVVLCEFGRSRSRAVAEWIADRRKIVAVGDTTKGRPNALLAGLLTSGS